ncbi:unnamed protein product [Brassica oleracea var. botrytis]|uniref:(rape) hypothetical protein n=1 Tax=Brassica napus TaxID=3708 RepID=A0A816LFE9_BRANA|nr:unnamed protein product [Brassica napus]
MGFSMCVLQPLLEEPSPIASNSDPFYPIGRGGSLSELYISAKRILLRARDGIERLERFESAALMDSSDLTSSVKRDITEVQSLCASMDGSKRLLDDSFSSGVAILAKYAEQRDRLNFEVGLSNSVLRLIERHNRVDTCIKYAENNVSISPWNRSHHPMNYHGAGSSAVAYRRSIPSVSLLLLGP